MEFKNCNMVSSPFESNAAVGDADDRRVLEEDEEEREEEDDDEEEEGEEDDKDFWLLWEPLRFFALVSFSPSSLISMTVFDFRFWCGVSLSLLLSLSLLELLSSFFAA